MLKQPKKETQRTSGVASLVMSSLTTQRHPQGAGGVSNETRAERRLASNGPRSAATLSLTSGEVHGDCPLPLAEKLLDSLPWLIVDDKMTQVCWQFNTHHGCSQPCCSFAHVLMPPESFSAAWHCLFLSWRGHHSLNGTVCKEKILALLSPAQLQEAQGHTGKAYDKLLFYALANRLGALVHATNEPQPSKPVQSGVPQFSSELLCDS